MHTPADSVEAYLQAKDLNRPYRMAQAFAADASLCIKAPRDAISFPPMSFGRTAITDTLVRRFARSYENIHTVCLAPPPVVSDVAYRCAWLVAMSEKHGHAVRVGCGRYDWRFDPSSGLAHSLHIHIDVMQLLAPETLSSVMGWAASLPSPWCDPARALQGAPRLDALEPVLNALASPGALAAQSVW